MSLSRRAFLGALPVGGLALSSPWWVGWIAKHFGPTGTIHDTGRVREATAAEAAFLREDHERLVQKWKPKIEGWVKEALDGAQLPRDSTHLRMLMQELEPSFASGQHILSRNDVLQAAQRVSLHRNLADTRALVREVEQVHHRPLVADADTNAMLENIYCPEPTSLPSKYPVTDLPVFKSAADAYDFVRAKNREIYPPTKPGGPHIISRGRPVGFAKS